VKTSAAPPPGVALALTATVLALHLWLVHGTRAHVKTAAPTRASAFATRRIEPAPQPAQQPAPVIAARVPAALRVRTPPPRPGARQLQLAPAPSASSSRPEALTVSPAPTPAPEPQRGRIAVPAPFELRYQVTAVARRQPVQGTSQLLWTQSEDGYEASFDVMVDGMAARRQHSAGQVTAEGLRPLRFAEKIRGEQATHFEREAGRVSFSNNRPAVALLAGAQDRLSVLIQLSAMFAGDPGKYPPGTSIVVQTATTREAENWVFTVEAQEQLQLPAADMTTVKLIRLPRGEYDPRMEIWLAPGKAYVPVRLRLTQPNGDWVDHQWSATDRR